MKNEIEEVIKADDEAAARLEEARAEADGIEDEARKTADRFIAEQESELASALEAEQQRVFSEAEVKVRTILVDAEMYIERTRKKKETVLDGLVEQLLKKMTALDWRGVSILNQKAMELEAGERIRSVEAILHSL